MPVICDGCETEISLSEAEDVLGEILCEDCIADEDDEESDDPAPRTFCCGCMRSIKISDTRDSRKGPLCPLCAHGYELERFTPPDHKPATCSLCRERKKKGLK